MMARELSNAPGLSQSDLPSTKTITGKMNDSEKPIADIQLEPNLAG
jgi:hypothetical protein